MPATGSTRKPQTSERLWHQNVHSRRGPQQHWLYSSALVDTALQMDILRSEQRRVALMIAVLTLLLLFIVSISSWPRSYIHLRLVHACNHQPGCPASSLQAIWFMNLRFGSGSQVCYRKSARPLSRSASQHRH
jgi:hypothetical protein